MGPALQSREYNVYSSSHPVQGESQNNHILQGENSSENSHNSSGWTSGFTTLLQDLSMDLVNARHPPIHQESGSQVSPNSTFQQIYTNAKGAFEKIYFSLNSSKLKLEA